MKENSIRRAVREGRAALGTGLKEFASRGVPWIIEEAGFDYCAIDHEHGAFDMETIANLASWFQATNVTAIVRIHKSFAHLIPGILDQAIMGIQVSEDRKSTRLNSSHVAISYAVFCLKKIIDV